MNHPSKADLAGYLYDELAPEQATEIRQHLQSCQECASTMKSWQSVRTELSEWTLPAPQPARKPLHASGHGGLYLRRIAAAAVLILAGYGLAQLTTNRNTQSLSTAQWRNELRTELARFASENGSRQEQFQEALTKTLGRIEAQRLADYARLRRDMETVAVRTEDELLTTRQDLARLASVDASKTPVLPQ